MDIIVSGSIAYDYLMRFPGKFAEYFLRDQMHQVSLSFLVEDMTKHWGGNAANIAFTMAKLGLRPKVFGTAGRDFGDYRAWLERAGVDTSIVQQLDHVFTASFFANSDLDNNQISSFYSGAMAEAKEFTLGQVYAGVPDLVVISPNDPQAMTNLARECQQRAIPYVFDPSQQIPRLSGDDLRAGIEGAYILAVNAYESEIIANKTGMTIDQMRESVEIMIITQSARGSHIYANGDRIEVPAFPPTEIKDPTGVGDAYRSGLLTGIAHGWPLKLAGEVGALCATYVLEQVGTQSHHFTIPEFIERFRTRFDDEGRLDELMQ